MSDAIVPTSSQLAPIIDTLFTNFARAKVPSFPSGITAPTHPASSADVGPTVPTAGFEGLNHPRSIIARCPIQQGRAAELRKRLEGDVFTVHADGVHNARFVVLDDQYLLFTAIYDVARVAVLQYLQANAVSVDEVWGHCVGYPPRGASDLSALDAYLERTDIEVLLMFNAYSDPGEPQVREAVALRRNFLGFARAVQQDPGGILTLYDAFVNDNRRRIVASGERHMAEIREMYPRIPGNKTTAFTMVTTIKPDFHSQLSLRTTLAIGDLVVNNFRVNPISEMVTVHYARFGIWDYDQLMFASIYDGDWVQYVEDFSTRIPFQMNKVWGNCIGWPPDGATDTKALRRFLEEHTVETDVFYSAYMDVTSKDILASYALGKALWNFMRTPPASTQSFRARYLAFLSANQALLS